MSRAALPKATTKTDVNTAVDERAEAYERQRLAELNAQHQELRDQARAYLAAVKGRCGVRGEEDWKKIFVEAKTKYESGRFLIEQLGAERFLEPELMATLVQLRRDLLAGIENPTAVDTMMVDVAILAYRDLLRIQGWMGNLCLLVEGELFGQASLCEIHGPRVGRSWRKPSAVWKSVCCCWSAVIG